jgi:hypothetical protein
MVAKKPARKAGKVKKPAPPKRPAKPAPKRAKAKRKSKLDVARERVAERRQAAADNTAAKQPPPALVAHQFKPGQSGNPKGRPLGARSKLGELFLENMLEAWEIHGKAAIEDAIAESPSRFVNAVAKVIPKELHHKIGDVDDMTDEEMDEAIERGLAVLGRASVGGGGGGGAPDGGASGAEEARTH